MTRSQLHRAWKDAQAKVRVCRHTVREKGEELAEAEGDLATLSVSKTSRPKLSPPTTPTHSNPSKRKANTWHA